MNKRPRRWKRFALASGVVAALILVPVGASALWGTSATPPAPRLQMGTLAAPAIVCTSKSAGLGLEAWVEISWPAVPGANGYTITVGNDLKDGVITTTMISTRVGLIPGIIHGLVGLLGLQLGQTGTVTIASAAGEWRSAPSNAVRVTRNLLGYACAP